MVKTLKLTEEQMALLKELLSAEKKFLLELEERVAVGFFGDIKGFEQRARQTISNNSTINYGLFINKSNSFHEQYYDYIKSVVELYYKMQCLYIAKFENQIWWSEGCPADVTLNSLEDGVPEETLVKRDRLKELLDAL